MADECDLSEIVTTFLLKTCRLPPWPGKHRVQAVVDCAAVATEHPRDDEEADIIPLTTGSVAEFYIEPMLPLVGDIDIMHHSNTELAIPRGHPPPTQLPAEFHNYVKVVEIIDSHLPGYVYLPLRYLLSQRTDDGKYEYFEDHNGLYLINLACDNRECLIHGPAVLTDNSHTAQLSIDAVPCVRCLSWPPQAADWPTRHRNYGWPDSATLDRVVSNGCDVVGVAHRQCRQHEWMGKRQHRLSFSRAEIVLINSWMPIQQIAYHLLRYCVKTERLTESADNPGAGTLSNYHIKTLMLWACELKPRSCWTENLNLFRICVDLLNTLYVWLTDTRCPHYFINSCNLLDRSLNVGSVASKLMSVDEQYLSTWFIRHYIGQCAQLCPFDVSQLFWDVSTSVKLQKAVSEIGRWRFITSLYDMWNAIEIGELRITLVVSAHSLTVHSCSYWMNELTKVDKRLSIYFTSIVLLHVARKTSRNGFSLMWKDVLSTIRGLTFNQCCSVLSRCITELNTLELLSARATPSIQPQTSMVPHNSSQCCSVLSRCETEQNTSELVELLQKSAGEQLTTYRQLMARVFSSVATIVTTDFEALYAYKRGDYQRCLQLSTQNVHTLLYAHGVPDVPILPEFIQLMDDDIVSLTALTLMVNPKCRDRVEGSCITQLTLSLYLMTQCQLKLRHSVTSLAQTLAYIKVAQRRHARDRPLDQLTLKLAQRKVGLIDATAH